MSRIDKLLSIGSAPIGTHSVGSSVLMVDWQSELRSLLGVKNGFSAFEAALIVFPLNDAGGVYGLSSWNARGGWRDAYSDCFDDQVLFFAHDVFGVQFGLTKSGVVRLDPESGEVALYASSLEGWASKLLENYEQDTGWPVAHDWQVENRPLRRHERLLPKQPFVLGGDYEVENLVAVEALFGMRSWGALYSQIRDLRDGEVASVEGWLI